MLNLILKPPASYSTLQGLLLSLAKPIKDKPRKCKHKIRTQKLKSSSLKTKGMLNLILKPPSRYSTLQDLLLFSNKAEQRKNLVGVQCS